MPSNESTFNPQKALKEQHPELAQKYEELWNKMYIYLKDNEKMEEMVLNTWLGKDVYIVSIAGGTMALYTPQPFYKDVIEMRFGEVLREAAQQVTGKRYELIFLNLGEQPPAPDLPKQAPSPQRPAQQGKEEDYEYTFDTFIVGNSNRFAHAAAVAVANTPATAYNPLFIYGGSGLGKTHLLYAIMNKTRENNPNANIVYLKGDDFTNELIQAIQNGKQMEFRSKYRYADLFLVDDIQFIAGKDSTQDEFFHTFNTLYEAKKQIVLTSDRPPKEIATLEERLRTRFEWGLLADVQPPDFETRMAIIRRKANILEVDLPEEVLNIIANNVKTNIRQLEGAVKKLKAFHQLTGAQINATITMTAIKDMFTDGGGKALTPENIIMEVARYHSLKPADLIGKKRTSEVTMPRQIAMYIIRETTDLSLPNIGKSFGGRDHTTVMHAIKKVEQEMTANPAFRNQVEELIKNLKEGE